MMTTCYLLLLVTVFGVSWSTGWGEVLSDIVDLEDGEVHVIDGDQFKEACLMAHNTLRELHNAPPLEYDDALASGASEWAQTQCLAGNKPAKHATKPTRKAGNFGENIFLTSAQRPMPVENAVMAWYNEHKCWDYDNNAKLPADQCENFPTGHLTQELWAGSVRIGCGLAFKAVDKKIQGRDYKITMTYVVVRYSPPGNRKRAMNLNIFPPEENAVLPDDPEDLVDY